jgi:imidazolonepropionase-like amidohydrolase
MPKSKHSMQCKLLVSKLLIDGTGNPPIEAGAILIRGPRIEAVGGRSEFEVNSACDIIDCSDQVVMPGLIDAHNHLSLDSSLDNYLEHMQDPLPVLTIRAVKNMDEDLKAGITTVRCMGDRGFLDIECKRAVVEDYITGPRIITAGKGIRSSAGHGYVGLPHDGIESVRAAVRENVQQGADWIKFYVTGTLPENNVPSFFSREEIELIVSEAKRLGKKTAVHCIGGIGLKWCLELEVDTIEHGFFMTADDIETLKASRSHLVMTPSFYLSDERINQLPARTVTHHKEAQRAAAKCMSEVISAGLDFAVGTDGVHGKNGLVREIELLKELGATEEKILESIGRYGAEVCDVNDITGTIEPGKYADIIGVSESPLERISALRDIKTVVARGNLLRKEAYLA